MERLATAPQGVLQTLQGEGLALMEAGFLKLTRKGKALVDSIAEALLI
jgi:coproporphyrinogen III oxidase-like Fe-S oxidoreductase